MPTELPPTLTQPAPTATKTVTPTPTTTPAFTLGIPDKPPVNTRTRDILLDTQVPLRDPLDLAFRLLGKHIGSRTLPPPTSYYEQGDTQQFWIGNNDTAKHRLVDTTLQYVTEHAYFWVEDSVPFRASDIQSLTESFEEEIYPRTRAIFGSEWTPGVDGDPHVYIVLARDIGAGVAGFFSSGDEYPPDSLEGSNGHEMFVLSGDNLNLARSFTYSVLAHEFQHMIHWNVDRDETSFITEGLSELAQLLNGFTEGYTHDSYLARPDYQLNDWPNYQTAGANYGASYLFMLYFLERFGEASLAELVAEQANGLFGIGNMFETWGTPNHSTGDTMSADDFVLDWTIANMLDDASIEDGRFGYSMYPQTLHVSSTEIVWDCNSSPQYHDVHQYGVDYIRISCNEPTSMLFEGDVETRLLPADAYSGDYAFWGNRGHQADMTLTRSFDFTQYTGLLTFSYWTWYDIESDWDYVYVLVSTDGESWEMLNTPSGTDSDPSGNNYGWALTGRSGGVGNWIQESIDISKYAGKEVQLRFEYITDTAVNGEGILIDDISIDEIGYYTDFEAGDDGWRGEGFVRIENVLPQTFRLALISIGDEITVSYISLDDFNRAVLTLDFSEFDEYILVVLGTTRFTRQLAGYSYTFAP